MIIEARDLSKHFGSFTAVDKLNLQIGRGEIFGFLGANGAGKTTTIRMLCGLLKPSSGSAHVNGFDCSRESDKVKASIGYMSQKFSLYDDLKVKENIEFYASIYQAKSSLESSAGEDLLKTLGLAEKLDVMTRELPVGFKQRLGLLCALLHDPPVLFLDEPTSGVDPQARREFWEVINSLAEKGKTVLVSTHYMDEAEYCHRVIVMRTGKETAMGAPQDLKREYNVQNMQELFLKFGAGD